MLQYDNKVNKLFVVAVSFDGDTWLVDSCPLIVNLLAVDDFEEA